MNQERKYFTLEEAIDDAKDSAEKQRPFFPQCANMMDQVVRWLEELRKNRAEVERLKERVDAWDTKLSVIRSEIRAGRGD